MLKLLRKPATAALENVRTAVHIFAAGMPPTCWKQGEIFR